MCPNHASLLIVQQGLDNCPGSLHRMYIAAPLLFIPVLAIHIHPLLLRPVHASLFVAFLVLPQAMIESDNGVIREKRKQNPTTWKHPIPVTHALSYACHGRYT